MALARWEMEQRSKGNALGADLGHDLIKHFEDVPLTPENVHLFHKFPSVTREKLIKEGFLIYNLTGRSIEDISRTNPKIKIQAYSADSQDPTYLSTLISSFTEVAIDPNNILFHSNYLVFDFQKKILQKYNELLQNKHKKLFPKAVIGSLIDYLDIAFQHLERTGKYMFGWDQGLDSTFTSTPAFRNGRSFATIGCFNSNTSTISISYGGSELNGNLCIAPLIVPSTF